MGRWVCCGAEDVVDEIEIEIEVEVEIRGFVDSS